VSNIIKEVTFSVDISYPV